METYLDLGSDLQPIVSAYLHPFEAKEIYEATGMPINAEHADVYLSGGGGSRPRPNLQTLLAMYNPRLLRSVRLEFFKPTDDLSLLIPFKLKRLTFQNTSFEEFDEDEMAVFMSAFQEIALTLEELEFFDYDDELDRFASLTFPHLKRLFAESWYNLQAPSLSSLEIQGQTEVVDIADVIRLHPNLEHFININGSVDNTNMLSKLPLSSLQLDDTSVDTPLDLTPLKVTDLILVNVPVTGTFPKTLRNLKWDGDDANPLPLSHLKLRTLTLSGPDAVLNPIKMRNVSKLDLGSLILDAFYIDGKVLTELDLSGCTVKYVDVIQAPVLTKVKLTHCNCTDFIPDSVVELSITECSGSFLSAIKYLVNLKVLHVTKTEFNLRQVKRLHLIELSLNQCNVTTLKYLRTNTLKELTLSGEDITDAVMSTFPRINLRSLDLRFTSITDASLAYLAGLEIGYLSLGEIKGSGLVHLDPRLVQRLGIYLRGFHREYVPLLRQFSLNLSTDPNNSIFAQRLGL